MWGVDKILLCFVEHWTEMLSFQSRMLCAWSRYLCALLAVSEEVVWCRGVSYSVVSKFAVELWPLAVPARRSSALTVTWYFPLLFAVMVPGPGLQWLICLCCLSALARWKQCRQSGSSWTKGVLMLLLLASCLSLEVRAKSCSVSTFGTGARDLLLQLAVVSEEPLGMSPSVSDWGECHCWGERLICLADGLCWSYHAQCAPSRASWADLQVCVRLTSATAYLGRALNQG